MNYKKVSSGPVYVASNPSNSIYLCFDNAWKLIDANCQLIEQAICEKKITAFGIISDNIVIGSSDKEINLYNKEGEHVKFIGLYTSCPTYIQCDELFNDVIVSFDDFSIKRINITNHTQKSYYGHKAPILSFHLNNEFDILASSSCDGTIRLWDYITTNCRKTVTILPKHNSLKAAKSYCRLCWDPSNQYLAVPIFNQVKIFKGHDLTLSTTLKHSDFDQDFCCVSYLSPNILAAASDKGLIEIFDTKSAALLKRLDSSVRHGILNVCWMISNAKKENNLTTPEKDLDSDIGKQEQPIINIIITDREGGYGYYTNVEKLIPQLTHAINGNTKNGLDSNSTNQDPYDNFGEDSNDIDAIIKDNEMLDGHPMNRQNTFSPPAKKKITALVYRPEDMYDPAELEDISAVKANYYKSIQHDERILAQTEKDIYVKEKQKFNRNTNDKITPSDKVSFEDNAKDTDTHLTNEHMNDFYRKELGDDYFNKGNLKGVSFEQKPFQPGSTPAYMGDHFLKWNDVGIIQTYQEASSLNIHTNEHISDKGSITMIECEFLDKSIHHTITLRNSSEHYSMADISNKAILFGRSCQKRKQLSALKCIHFTAWHTEKEWELTLPPNEDLQGLVLGQDWLAIACNAYLIRILTLTGIEGCFAPFFIPGRFICMASNANNDYVLDSTKNKCPDLLAIVYSNGLCPCLYLYNVKVQQTIISNFPIPCHTTSIGRLKKDKNLESLDEIDNVYGEKKSDNMDKLVWIGFCSSDLYVVLSSGWILKLAGNTWVPILNTKNLVPNPSDNYWVIGIQSMQDMAQTLQIKATLCRGSNYPLTLPKPNIVLLGCKLPLINQMDDLKLNSPESSYALQNDYITLHLQSTKTLNPGNNYHTENECTSLMQDREKLETEKSKCLMKLFALYCQSGEEMRAYTVVESMKDCLQESLTHIKESQLNTSNKRLNILGRSEKNVDLQTYYNETSKMGLVLKASLKYATRNKKFALAKRINQLIQDMDNFVETLQNEIDNMSQMSNNNSPPLEIKKEPQYGTTTEGANVNRGHYVNGFHALEDRDDIEDISPATKDKHQSDESSNDDIENYETPKVVKRKFESNPWLNNAITKSPSVPHNPFKATPDTQTSTSALIRLDTLKKDFLNESQPSKPGKRKK